MKQMPQPIPYQGSKRNIAASILSLIPDGVQNLVEPFAGSAAISVRAAYAGKANHFYLNDLNQPLITRSSVKKSMKSKIGRKGVYNRERMNIDRWCVVERCGRNGSGPKKQTERAD